jgi:hypothetical protein
MADPSTYQRVILKFFTPFSRKDAEQEWQVKFNISGDLPDNKADAEEAVLALADPILSLTSTNTYLGGALWYNSGSTVNEWQWTYASTDHPGTASAYDTLGDGNIQQLEVCALVHAVVGVSSTGKAVYLQKHIHDVYGANDAVGNLLANTADFSAWSTGFGVTDYVTISPTTGGGSEPWVLHGALYTRQLRRGEKAPS